MNKDLQIHKSNIPGLLVIDLVLFEDNRGWFKENYQQAKLKELGFPDFNIVQNNFSYNKEIGATRGLHAEPWNKYISVANGRVFGAWVDLRAGESFGQTFTTEITPNKAIYVPKGIANGYQTLEEHVTYTYLVDDHWSPKAKYTFLNLFDSTVNISWPITKSRAIISDKDAEHPFLSDVIPMELS